MRYAICITLLALFAGCNEENIKRSTYSGKLAECQREYAAYRDSVEALASKWAVVDEIVAGIDKSAPSAANVLSAVVTLAQAGLFTQIGASPSLSCNGEPLTDPVDYRWQMEFTTPRVPEFIYFLTTSTDSIRMRVHPIDSQGRVGCDGDNPAWSEWLEVED